MTIREFIKINRAEITRRVINAYFKGQTLFGGSHPCSNDKDRRQWILNDEGLYNWARSEGVKI